MKLSDWRVAIRENIPELECEEVIGTGAIGTGPANQLCGMSFSIPAPELGHNARTVFEQGAFGELAQSIVEHARVMHGVELESDGSHRYSAYTPDGKLWGESSDPDDFRPDDLEGMDGEELEHFGKRNAELAGGLTFKRATRYVITVVEDWKP